MKPPRQKQSLGETIFLVAFILVLAVLIAMLLSGCSTTPMAAPVPPPVPPPNTNSFIAPLVIMPSPEVTSVDTVISNQSVDATGGGAASGPILTNGDTLIIPLSTVPTNGARADLQFSPDGRNWTTIQSNIYLGGVPGVTLITNHPTSPNGFYRTKRTQ